MSGWAYAVTGGSAAAAATPMVLGFAPSRRSGLDTPARPRDGGARWAVALACLGALATFCVVRAVDAGARPAFAVTAVAMLLAAAVDARVRRLPNVIVLPATVTVLVLLWLGQVSGTGSGSVARSVLALGVVVAVLTVAALVAPGSIGMGDARYLALAAAALAYDDPLRLLAAAVVLAGALLVAVVLSLARGGGWHTHHAVGPFVCGATLLALAAPAGWF